MVLLDSMIRYTTGNLLEADVEALVNTVNTVGVMGKGIALMFKDRYHDNFKTYAAAAKKGQLEPGELLINETHELSGPKWIVNFATKKHWRHPSKIEWIASGLDELRIWIENKGIESIAIPPLGCGNGQLEWPEVKTLIDTILGGICGAEIVVYEPTRQYQNVAKKSGVKKLTLARALVSELIRRYWALGFDCTLLEAQKLVYFLSEIIDRHQLRNDLKLTFVPERYGPYADNLFHLLDEMDGSYLHCEKRIRDATRNEYIWFEVSKTDELEAFLKTGEARSYRDTIDKVFQYIESFESPLELEALSTVDWLHREKPIEPEPTAVKNRLKSWPGGQDASDRKLRLFTDELIIDSSERVTAFNP